MAAVYFYQCTVVRSLSQQALPWHIFSLAIHEVWLHPASMPQSPFRMHVMYVPMPYSKLP